MRKRVLILVRAAFDTDDVTLLRALNLLASLLTERRQRGKCREREDEMWIDCGCCWKPLAEVYAIVIEKESNGNRRHFRGILYPSYVPRVYLLYPRIC